MTERGTFVINGASVSSYPSCTVRRACSSSMHTNGTKLYSARIIFKVRGSTCNGQRDGAYIDQRSFHHHAARHRLRGDQQILEIFDLADEVKVTKANQEGCGPQARRTRAFDVGRGLRDEDTGEVVDRAHNVIVDRETVLEEEHGTRFEAAPRRSSAYESLSGIDFLDHIPAERPWHPRRRLSFVTSTGSALSPTGDGATSSRSCFLGRYDLRRYRINKKLDLIPICHRTLTREISSPLSNTDPADQPKVDVTISTTCRTAACAP